MKQILGKDKWNHNKVGNVHIDMTDQNPYYLSVSFQINFSKNT